MKLASLALIGILSLATSAFADNRHSHPSFKSNDAPAAEMSKTMTPGYCEIEVVNTSFDNIVVYGTFEDNTPLTPFNIYRFEYPHYISLYYRDYDGIYRCHNTMYLSIETFDHYLIYSDYTKVGTTLRIFPFAGKTPKAAVETK